MKRTYLAVSDLAVSGLAAAATLLPSATAPLAALAGTFGSEPVAAERLAVLARPVGQSDWNLLVLEQLRPTPLCWHRREDGLIDPVLNRFDFSGICSRYLDSNAYSLRAGSEDHGGRYRLRLQQVGQELQLQAFSPDQPTVLTLGRSPLTRRDRDGFVAINLENGWQLERRTFGTTTLSHLYFAHTTPLPVLISQANGSGTRMAPPPKMPPPLHIPSPMARIQSASEPDSPFSPASRARMTEAGEGPIALQVIPYRSQPQ